MTEIPGYTLLRPLGRGGMGEVHVAVQESLGREVALKLLARALAQDDTARERFVREARIAANLHHPNIVPIYEVGVHDGTPFIAMEYEPAGTVSALARQGVETATALHIVRDIAQALDYAHELGVVHRDVKPDNILRREKGLCLLSDFGIAHAVEAKTILTQEGASVGTPQYMSPEQLRGQLVDGRSDLYSLGVVLYQLLTGRLPYDAGDAWAIGVQHINDPIPRLPTALAHLQSLIDALMAKDPGARPASGADVVRRIDALLAGTTPVPTTPIDAARAPAKTPRRTLAVIGAAIVAAAVVAAAAWQPWRAGTLPAAPAAAVAAADRKSIAVLPFANLSGRAEDAYLADGLQEEVLNALARLRDMKVISRTSVMQYRDQTRNAREIGERLGVGTILEGSIRRDGNTLRLTVQLIDSRNDNHLLAANYDRDMTHVLELQSAVARQVAEALSATLGRAERGELDRVGTNSGDAYDRYLRAVALYRRSAPSDVDGLVEPMRLLGEALDFDPDYADALALLSQARTWTFFGAHRAADGEAARQAFERALAIDQQLPEAQLARGLYAMYVTENLDLALADLTAVVQRRPSSSAAHDSLAFALRRRARFAEALEQQLRALDLDPLNQIYHHSILTTLQALRRFPELTEHTRLYAQRFPNSPDPYLIRARVESYRTHSAEPLRNFMRDHGTLLDADLHAVVEAEIAAEEGRYLDAVRLLDTLPVEDALSRGLRVGVLYLEGGDAARAEHAWRDAERAAEQRLKSGTSPVDAKELAIVQSLLGEHAAALETIEAARAKQPEARDATNGPVVSFIRSVVLVRAGRQEEGYAEAARLLRVPFGSPLDFLEPRDPVVLLLKDDPHYDELIHRPPRL